jgi:glycolate dehydrogenase FAD-binding subunit
LPSVSEGPLGLPSISEGPLDRILEHEAGDLTCTVEAEMRLAALQEALAPHGQMLALDPPGDPTLGACLAANLSGPRRHRYGTMRDLVIGTTVVLPDGTVASSGGKVVKNVAGYDLGKLLCGSEGRLGRIVRLSLRLHPKPDATATVVAPAEPAAASTVLRSTLVPSAVDVHWPERLALLFEGSEGAVAAQVEAARELVGAEAAGDDVWAEAAERQAGAQGRLSFSPGALADVLALEDEAIVRVAAGVAYVPHEVPDPRDPAEIALVERIRSAFGGPA